MPQNAALCVTLLGIAIVLITGRSKRAVTTAQLLAMLTVTIAAVALVGYAYGAINFFRFPRSAGC